MITQGYGLYNRGIKRGWEEVKKIRKNLEQKSGDFWHAPFPDRTGPRRLKKAYDFYEISGF